MNNVQVRFLSCSAKVEKLKWKLPLLDVVSFK